MLFSPVKAEQYTVRPYIAHKSQSYSFSYLGGSNPSQITIDLAVSAPAAFWLFSTGSEQQNPDGIYARSLYASVRHLFFSTSSHTFPLNPATPQYALPTGTFYVINAAQISYGESIKLGSFRLASPSSTASLTDDGHGNIVNSNGVVVGNIFYSLGVALVNQDLTISSASLVSPVGMYANTGSTFNISFNATQTIYEHTVVCTMKEYDFMFTANPTVLVPSSSQGTQIRPRDLIASGSLTPYISTIGCYSNRGELLVIGKLPQPVKRTSQSQQTFVIRWDV